MRKFLVGALFGVGILAANLAEAQVRNSFLLSGQVVVNTAQVPAAQVQSAYVTMFLYDEQDREISHRLVGRYNGQIAIPFNVKLVPGIQKAAFYLTDAQGIKLHNGCYGTEKIVLDMDKSRSAFVVIRNLCLLTWDGALSGKINLSAEALAHYAADSSLQLLVELSTRAGALSRTRVYSLNQDSGIQGVDYYINEIYSSTYTLNICLIDKTGRRVTCSSPGLKFMIERKDNSKLDVRLGN